MFDFIKKIFGGGEDKQKPQMEGEKGAVPSQSSPNAPKEVHDKEHQGGNKKPSNVCEFC